jgi:thymidine kinase
MPKLYFRHGVVTSGKSLDLLSVRTTYIRQNKSVIVIKPMIDVRNGANKVSSRFGPHCEADYIISQPGDVQQMKIDGVSCVLAEESQFFTTEIVDALWKLTPIVPVICYGLRTDFQARLFEGSKRLLELADSIEEIKTTCLFCNTKACFNVRHRNGLPIREGNQIELGSEDSYAGVCHYHYLNFSPL